MYNYVNELCRKSAELILNHVNLNVHGIGQGLTMHWKYAKLKYGVGQAYNRLADQLKFQHRPSLTGNLYIPFINVT
jgi:hypothetical protein